MMNSGNANALYLDLLKKSLTGYLHIDNEYLNAAPSEYWRQKSWPKTLRNKIVLGLLKKSGMMVLRKDKRTPGERREARQNGADWPYFFDTMVGIKRLDGDMYGSTMVTLTSLYDKVSVGGFIVVDDYGLGPCRKAVEDFRNSREIGDEIVKIDDIAVYWRKSG